MQVSPPPPVQAQLMQRCAQLPTDVPKRGTNREGRNVNLAPRTPRQPGPEPKTLAPRTWSNTATRSWVKLAVPW